MIATIQNMEQNELRIAIDLATQEGWNPGLHDAETFYFADSEGFFIEKANGEVIGVASMVNYDSVYSFFGLYIVTPEYRSQGYGMALTERCLEYAANRNIGLDGVIENVHLYERIGFKLSHQNMRNEHRGFTVGDQDFIIPAAEIPIEILINYDRQCFPAPRDIFLSKWINQPQSTAYAYLENGELKGYGVCRKCVDGYKIGPLFADTFEIAETLFLALQNRKNGEKIFIDTPENNLEAIKLSKKYNMSIVFKTARMYSICEPKIAHSKIFGVTTFELG